MNSKIKYALFAFVIAGAMLSSAHADTVTVTLTPSTETGVAGDTVTYSAIIAAPATNGAAVYFNNETVDLNGLTGATADGTDLFTNFPFDLDPGTSASGDLFTVTLPATATPGSYAGDFILQGGADLSTYDTLATVPFTLDVPGSVSPVPEPSTWILLGSGLLGIAGLGWRQRSMQLTLPTLPVTRLSSPVGLLSFGLVRQIPVFMRRWLTAAKADRHLLLEVA